MDAIIILAVAGIIVSLYGIIVEKNIRKDAQYKPACDISDAMSCSKAVLSPYSKMLGISNVWAALLYYCAILILALSHQIYALFIVCCLGGVASLVFAYILYFKVRTVCLICTAFYVINIACVFVSYSLLRLL